MTNITIVGGAIYAPPAARTAAAYQRGPHAMPEDLGNLLQVATSAFHLIDRQIDDDLRPLIQIGLAAISRASSHFAEPMSVAKFMFIEGVR